MDDELLKRNTDCVYFLASPFTCKKGAECEYRHSEMARLNPRDCWYWLSGKCLNPTCGFRHPPMDTHTEASAQGEHFPNNSGLPPIKNNVPCYYFFQGRCDKGDKCTFLHGSEDTSAVKPKIESAPTALPSLDTKIPSKVSVTKLTAEQLDSKLQPLTMVDTKIRNRMTDSKLCLLTEPVPDPLEKSLGLLEVPLKTADKLSMHQEKQIQSSDTCIILEGKTVRQELASEFEEAHVNKSASLNPPENIVRSDISIYSDQSSDDRVDKDVVRDELWESSPGFDVLVEGRSEGMTYGDEHEYMHGYNDEDNENHLLDHHYEDQNGSSESLLHENRMRDPCYYSDDDERYDTNGYSHVVRGDNRIMPQKRKLGLPFGGHYSGDLREHLSKRRFHESRDSFRRCSFPLYTEERHEEPIQRLHGRLASKLERNGISLMKQKEPVFIVPNQRDEIRNSELTARHHHHHHHHERKRLQFSSRVQKKPFSRPNRESDSNISFTGPKTLAQIKEEKDKAREGLSLSSEARHSSQNGLVGFEGPKPLTEILKEKKTSTSALDLI